MKLHYVIAFLLVVFLYTTSNVQAQDTKRYCYSAVIKHQTRGNVYYSAQFLTVTAPASATSSAIKSWAKDKIKSMVDNDNGKIIEETLDLDKECSDCKAKVAKQYTLANFQINRVTMQ